jgi:VWFA-related protein
MNKLLKGLTVFLSCGALIGSAVQVQAESPDPPAGKDVSVIVTAAGLHNNTPPLLTPDEVLVYRARERLPVVSVTLLQKERAGLDLAILFDDSLESNFSSQLAEITEFIRSLPPTTRVAVAYMRNSTFTMGQDFSMDRELAVKALQVPLGSPRQFDSPYLALTDLVMAMPDIGNRRAILVISDGVDRFRGPFEPVSPDLEPAYQEAQRRGVLIYTIYATGVGRASRNPVWIRDAQRSLTQLAEETGGEAFLEGFSPSASLRPYLQELRQMLEQQYLISFQAKPNATGGYEHFKFTTELPDVELIAPRHVYVPGSE